MTVKYTNRKRVTYYLHKDRSEAGKGNFYFSTELQGAFTGGLPRGFEIYEHPSAHVLLREKIPQLVDRHEAHRVNNHLKRLDSSRRHVVDVWGKDIIIYESNEEVSILEAFFDQAMGAGTFGGLTREEALQFSISYIPALRFILENEEKRLFSLWRYMPPGSIETWVQISVPDYLNALLERYSEPLKEGVFCRPL